jgi:hypothetical protein
MKFTQYMQKKDPAKINESQNPEAINERSGDDSFMKIIMSAVSYAKASAMLPQYKEATLAADTELNKAKADAKTLTITKRIKALELKKANLPDNKKEAVINQIEKLKDATANLSDQAEAKQNALNDAATNIKSELDEEVRKIEGGLGDLVSKKMTAISQEAKQAGLEAKAKVAKATGKAERAEKAESELKTLNDKHKDTLKKIEAGETSSEEDLKEVDGIEAVRPELENYLKVSKGMNAVKVTLNRLYSEAEAINTSNIDDSFDADQFIRGLSEEDSFDIFEDESKEKSVSPDDVRGKIMAGDKEEVDEKIALLKQLEKAIDSWEKTLGAQAEAKKAIWEKVKGKPTTKSVLKIAGADEESIKEESDGSFTASKLSPKWEALIDKTDDSPLVKIAETKKKIADENIPALEKEKGAPADASEKPTSTDDSEPAEPAEKTSEEDGKKEEIKTKIEAKKKELSDAQAAEKPQEEIDKLIDDLNALKKDLSDLGESVDYIDTFLKEFNSPAKVSAAPETKIMKFADFLANR